MKNICVGLLAHVDAGKTSLTESLLYNAKIIRKMGRVDHQNAYLDYDVQERERGITIYSKEVHFDYQDTHFCLIDTPGHVDFSSEMERCLSVLDYAILIISATDKVQSHTKTIFKLLDAMHIPFFIFVNKMDISYDSKDIILDSLRKDLNEHCVDILDEEAISLYDEKMMNYYLDNNRLDKMMVASLIKQRKIFPCIFGSALKNNNVDQLLICLADYTIMDDYDDVFRARVYKISYENNTKLSHLKILGGTLRSKMKINDDKVDQIRVYNGNKYELKESADAGNVVCVKGLNSAYSGMGLGDIDDHKLQLSSYLHYRLDIKDQDSFSVYRNLEKLKMEDPNLNINYDGKQINVSIMGEVQIEVLKKLIKERFGYDVEFSDAKINYMETISAPVEGVGHYEPLRHYGEVHLLLEPISKGVEICNGIDNTNDMHYQKVIMNFLESIELKGILTNSPLTNIRITLLAFKSHLKHSEPADFLECCKRAIRHALKRADNILLEPYYHFEIVINNNYVSKVLFDLDNFNAEYEISNIDNELVKIIGSASVAKMQNYNIKFLSLTSGMGKISMNIDGYRPCLEQEKVIADIAYDDESDIDNPSGSIFCAHGAGFYVNYEDVENYMHIPYVYLPKTVEQKAFHNKMSISDDELKRVWNNTYKPKEASKIKKEKKEVKDYYDIKETKPKCLLVDGYNVIFGWSDLKQMAAKNLDMARNRLIDHMSEYQAYRYDLVIVVFDAYKTEAVMENIIENKNVVIVYTKNKQTADTYIEKTVAKLTKDYVVSVATSDSLEQLTVMTQNAIRISSSELENDYRFMKKMIHDRLQKNRTTFYNHSLKDIIKYLE